MEFLKNNFDIQSSDELSDIAESTIQSGRNQKIENILAQINSKLEKMPAEERKEYLQKLRDRIDMTIIKKEKKLDLCQLFRHIFSNNIYLTVFKFIPISFWQAEIFLIFYSRLFD